MVRGLFMPLGRVILAASEARVRGQASRNSSATNIAICLRGIWLESFIFNNYSSIELDLTNAMERFVSSRSLNQTDQRSCLSSGR
jgi:hypothetical protein